MKSYCKCLHQSLQQKVENKSEERKREIESTLTLNTLKAYHQDHEPAFRFFPLPPLFHFNTTSNTRFFLKWFCLFAEC